MKSPLKDPDINGSIVANSKQLAALRLKVTSAKSRTKQFRLKLLVFYLVFLCTHRRLHPDWRDNTWYIKMDSKVSLNLIKNWQALCNDVVFVDIAPALLQNQVITVKEYQHVTNQPETAKMESLLLLLLKKNEKLLLKFGQSLEKDYTWLAEKVSEGCTEKGQNECRDETDATPNTEIHSATPTTEMDSRKIFENDTTTEDEKDMCMDVEELDLNKNFETDMTTEDEKDVCIEYNNQNSNRNSNLNNNRIHIKRRGVLKSRVKNRLKPKIHNTDAIVSSTTELLKPDLNDEVTHEVKTIMKNSSLLSKSWTTIAHSLGLTDRVHDIRFKVLHHGEDLNMCIVYLIEYWLEMFPKMATLSKLIEVLRCENYNRVADQLTEILYKKPVRAKSRIQ